MVLVHKAGHGVVGDIDKPLGGTGSQGRTSQCGVPWAGPACADFWVLALSPRSPLPAAASPLLTLGIRGQSHLCLQQVAAASCPAPDRSDTQWFPTLILLGGPGLGLDDSCRIPSTCCALSPTLPAVTCPRPPAPSTSQRQSPS